MDEREESTQTTRRKVVRKKVRWGRILFLLFLVAAVGYAGFNGAVWITNNIIHPPQAKVVAATAEIEKDEKLNKRINILLLGIDDGDSEAAATEPKRTDAMILLSVDPENNKVAVLSIPRDTQVVLPGHKDFAKINSAYTFGGTLMAKETVAKLLQVPIHYYALCDWKAFIEVIDLMGGVEIYVEKDMHYEDPYADLVIDIKHGVQHMDGKTAGKYVRFRSDELGDIGRVQRQQKFLKAATEQMFSIDNMMKIKTFLSALDKHIKTDLNTMTMLKAANSVKLFGKEKMQSCMLYGKPDDSTGISYWVVTKEDVNKSLDELGIPRLVDEEEKAAKEKAAKAEQEAGDNAAKLQPKDKLEEEKEKSKGKEEKKEEPKHGI